MESLYTHAWNVTVERVGAPREQKTCGRDHTSQVSFLHNPVLVFFVINTGNLIPLKSFHLWINVSTHLELPSL